LVAMSYPFLPMGESISGDYALPLSTSWLQLFSNTGASFQNIGMGLAAPSDPFNWVLLLLGSITFWAPNLALSFLLVSAKALAFFGTWRLLSLLTARGSLRVIFALVYALWPAFTLSQNQANIPAVIFTMTLPWFIFSLARSAKLGNTSSVRSAEQSWSWIAASGLLCAIVSVSAPSVLMTLLFLGLVFSVVVRKRLAALSLIALPAAALVLPYLVYQVFGNKSWLGVFADPTISLPSSQQTILESFLGQDSIFGWCAVGVIGLATVALLSRAKGVLLCWGIALIALANLWIIQGIRFTAGGVGSSFLPPTEWVSDSSAPAVALAALAVLVALVLWLDSITRSGFRRFVLTAVLFLAGFPLAFSSVQSHSDVVFTEDRNLPAIVAAEANAGSNLKLLVISRDENVKFRAELIWSDGIKLDTVSTAYRLSSINAGTSNDSQLQSSLSKLIANLVSANGKDPSQELLDAQVGFVLVPERTGNGDLGVALNSVSQLDQVGLTEFGQLWRVKAAVTSNKEKLSLWSITKTVQLGVIWGYVLLALPTSRGRKRKDALGDSAFEQDEVEQ
ncbi:MAG: hypothetical protein WCG32_01625, partial [Actinomycetes bacterium]